MTAPTLPVGHDRWTMDLADSLLPEDCTRREVLEGELVIPMTGARNQHNRVCARLIVALSASMPDGWEVLTSPTDVRMETGDVAQPDVLAARSDTIGEPRGFTEIPALVAEVLSPSTRRTDLVRKRRIYEAAGVGAYWILDPDAQSLTVLEPDELGRLVETVATDAGAPVELVRPWPVTFTWG